MTKYRTITCPECGQIISSRKRYHGHRFLDHVRNIVENVTSGYNNVARRANGVAFHLLVLLDGTDEGDYGDEYRIQVKSSHGWEDIEFFHHDL